MRRLNPVDETLNHLNKQIQKTGCGRQANQMTIGRRQMRHRTDKSHLWRLVKSLSAKKPHNSPNKGVRFADKTYLDPRKIANTFAHQFTPPPIRLADDKSKRQLKRQFHQLPLTGTPSVTPANTKEAIRLAKSSTAIGPDGISTFRLKKLAQCAINYLQSVNLNWTDT